MNDMPWVWRDHWLQEGKVCHDSHWMSNAIPFNFWFICEGDWQLSWINSLEVSILLILWRVVIMLSIILIKTLYYILPYSYRKCGSRWKWVCPDMVEEISMRFIKATALYAFNVGWDSVWHEGCLIVIVQEQWEYQVWIPWIVNRPM